MGADYTLYTEVKRKDGNWHAMNGMYYSEKEEQYVLSETYWNGSRTYFNNTYNKIKEIGKSIKASELSEDVLKKEDWVKEDTDAPIISVSWKELQKAIPKTNRKELSGFVAKRNIWAYENDNDEICEYLSGEMYRALSEEEKKEYEFYEWDDRYGWYSNLKYIAEKVTCQISDYMTVNNMWEEPEDIRIVCVVSW